MAVCHDARKGRNIGIHCSKPVAPPLHSTNNLKQKKDLVRSMKKSSLIVVALVALTSCSTVKTGDGSVSRLPKNTVVIRNRTQYHLEIFRNGVAWEIPAKFNGRTIQVPAIVSPHREVILYDATSFERENVYLGVNAIKSERMGCLEAFKIVRKHHFRINLGTNSQPVLVTIR